MMVQSFSNIRVWICSLADSWTWKSQYWEVIRHHVLMVDGSWVTNDGQSTSGQLASSQSYLVLSGPVDSWAAGNYLSDWSFAQQFGTLKRKLAWGSNYSTTPLSRTASNLKFNILCACSWLEFSVLSRRCNWFATGPGSNNACSAGEYCLVMINLVLNAESSVSDTSVMVATKYHGLAHNVKPPGARQDWTRPHRCPLVVPVWWSGDGETFEAAEDGRGRCLSRRNGRYVNLNQLNRLINNG